MNRLLIVDGSNLLFQMFFGMPARIANEQGKAIQGTLGFVGALLKIIRKTEPTHIAVFFDGEHESIRATLDSAYKANRVDYSEMPEENNPFSQLPDVYAALDYLGIKHAETCSCETDDWIAGYAFTYGQENEIVISSFDSDFFQLVTDHAFDLYLEVYVGRLRRTVHARGTENDLYWSALDHDFFDESQYAGVGNIGHILREIKLYQDKIPL